MNSEELRKKFLDFFKDKGHRIVSSSSLVPENDPSVLFTTAGMQQFKFYLQGEKDPIKDFETRHLVSCQKCFRTDDIKEVGDDIHHTFFEMLGNWSIGEDAQHSYFKEGAIKYALEFLVEGLRLDKNRFWITIFKDEKDIPKDEESKQIWLRNGIPEERIREFGMEDNFWGPVGNIGPCGPNSEIHYDRGEEFGCGNPDCGPNCPRCKRVVEIWNLVFMEYLKEEKGFYRKLPQRNVDTGIGFERLLAILEKKPSAYETDLFWPIILELEKLSGRQYEKEKRNFRIITDHLRGAVFLISEGIFPSNVERGYVLRRILRRAIRFGKLINLPRNFLIPLVPKVIEIYKDTYPAVLSKQADILTVIQNEEEKFEKTLEKGLKILKLQIEKCKFKKLKIIPGKIVFDLFQSYGFPLEITKEIAVEVGLGIDEKEFEQEFKKHQEISRAGKEKKFGGHGINNIQDEESKLKIMKLHTATHLLLQSLRIILDNKIEQKGSDITPLRLRLDFPFPRKLTDEEIKRVEVLVNQKIQEDLIVHHYETSYEEAIRKGALGSFKDRYPEKVTVYEIEDSRTKTPFSMEICAGPHVKTTKEIGTFKILKEEAVGQGIRRIKAIIE